MSIKSSYTLTISLFAVTALFGVVLSSSASATNTNTAQDNVTVSVPVSCTMNGTGMTSHNANIPNGTYQADIGTTTLKTFCNDNQGFAIYAIGYTNEEYGNTTLIGATGGQTIVTGTATTTGNPDVSNWAVKLATDSTATYPITLDNSFGAYSSVPSSYTKVAHRDSGTDLGTSAIGAELTTTYAAYISKAQKADTYNGKVKYTLVHPSDADAPVVQITFDDAYAAAGKQKLEGYYEMQDMSSTICSAVTLEDDESETTLIDSRDHKTYTVSKLKDGKCWMTQNLDHDIKTDGSVVYNSTTTDVPSTWTPSTATYPAGTTTWSFSHNTPESYDPGDLYWDGASQSHTPVSTGDSHYHLGNYYNWSAAVAMNDSSSYITKYQNINQSMCPVNWTLPKGGESAIDGSFQYLIEQYGWANLEMTNPSIWESPIKTTFGGRWYGSAVNFGDLGFYWSSTVYDNFSSYILTAGYSVVDNISGDTRSFGFSVRCVSR